MNKGLNLFFMILGTFLCALAFGVFILPANFVAGGVTGLASLVHIVCPISLSIIILMINILILMLGFLFVGAKFTVKTIGVSLLFPVFLDITQQWTLFEMMHPIMKAVLAGVLLGIGTSIIIKTGASCGGFDTIALILNKKYHVSITKAMKCMDVSVIAFQILSKPLSSILYGILVILITTYVMNKLVSIHFDAFHIHNVHKKYKTA